MYPSVTDLNSRKRRCLKLAFARLPLKLRKYKAWAWARNVVETKLANMGSSQKNSLFFLTLLYRALGLHCFLVKVWFFYVCVSISATVSHLYVYYYLRLCLYKRLESATTAANDSV